MKFAISLDTSAKRPSEADAFTLLLTVAGHRRRCDLAGELAFIRLRRRARNLACRTPAPRSMDPLSDHREKSAPTMRGRWQRARRRRTPPPPPRDCRDCFRSTPFEPLAPNPLAGLGAAVGIQLAGHCCGTILRGAFPLANAFTRLLATSVSAPGCNGVTNSSSGRRAALTAISAAS